MTFKHIPIISTIWHYHHFYRGYIGNKFFLFIGLTLLGSLLELASVGMILPLIQQTQFASAEVPAYLEPLYAMIRAVGLPVNFNTMAGLILALVWARGCIVFLQRAAQAHILADLVRNIRGSIASKFACIDYTYYCTKTTGYFANTVVNEARAASTSFNTYASSVSALVYVIIYLLGLVLLSPLMLVLACIFAVGMLWISRSLFRVVRHYSQEVTRRNSSLSHLMVQTIESFKYFRISNGFHWINKRMMHQINRLGDCYYRQQLAASLIDAVGEPIALSVGLGLILVQTIFFGESLVLMLPFFYLLYRAMRQLSGFQNTWQKYHSTIGSLESVEKTEREFRQHAQQTGHRQLPALTSAIRFDNVAFHYGKSPVLQGLDLAIPRHRSVALVGESGSGKTTIINLLTGVLQPTAGTILYDDIPHGELDYQAFRTRIGYVSQETVIFNETIAFNIALLDIDLDDPAEIAKLRHAATMARAWDFIQSTPNGLATQLEDRGMNLSAGQRQRLQIARELYKQPELLIMDEATSNLDPESEALIRESLHSMHGQITVLQIAHRLSTITGADTIYVLGQGKVVEQGSYQELVAAGGLFATMVERQDLN